MTYATATAAAQQPGLPPDTPGPHSRRLGLVAVNENTNGLLRQYLPKGTDLSIHSREDLAWIAHPLNDRPRKRLDYARPSELINDLLLR